MGDLHVLPLLGHDLPGRKPRKAHVYKEETGFWVWEHGCTDGIYRGNVYTDWAATLKAALKHLGSVCEREQG
jgi:hypothetical protein